MAKLLKWFFVVVGATTTVVLAYQGITSLLGIFPRAETILKLFGVIAIIAIIVFFIFSILRPSFGKLWQLEAMRAFFLGPTLNHAIEQTLNQFPKPSKKTLADLSAAVFKRLTLPFTVGLLVAMLPIILIINQNRILNAQNEKINIQNNLLEAERRSSLVFLMSNILDKVVEEIREQKQQTKEQFGAVPDSISYQLSEPLIGRIVALSRAFRPYQPLQADLISDKLVSPERGQLFIALMYSNLDSNTQRSIASSGDFSNATIGNIDLRNAHLNRARFSGADFSDMNFKSLSLSNAALSWEALFFGTPSAKELKDIPSVAFGKRNGADLSDADLSYADLRLVDLRGADLNRADLREAEIFSADLRGADLKNANLRNADLRFSLFSDEIRYADLRGADLREVEIFNAKLSGAKLSGANLSGGYVSNSNWITELERLNVEGWKEIEKRYMLKFDGNFYQITRKTESK